MRLSLQNALNSEAGRKYVRRMISDPKARPAAPARHERVLGSFIFPNLSNLAEDPNGLKWEPFHPGVEIHWIYREANHGPSAALIRFQPGATVPLHEHRGFEHIYILKGSQSDENGQLNAGSLMVHPPGTCHSIVSKEGCLVLAIYEKPPQFISKGISTVS
jgi:anti-sigma factor ChrR (cupin superfamily)